MVPAGGAGHGRGPCGSRGGVSEGTRSTADAAGDRVGPARSTDREIVEQISAVAHAPFREVWRRHEREYWLPVRRALEAGLAAHDPALADVAAAPSGDPDAAEAIAHYLRAVAEGVLSPVRAALDDPGVAASLEASIARAAADAAAAADQLPAQAEAPLSPTALRGGPGLGLGLWTTLKRVCARALRPIVWRREERKVPVARVARRHLDRVVLPHQARALRDSQRLRAVWLADLERAWSEWLLVVLASAGGEVAGAGSGVPKAGERLERRVRALTEGVPLSPGRAKGEDLDPSEATLRAAVAIAGTFVGGESVIPAGAGRTPRAAEKARRWDRRAGESAARLELCGTLLDAWDDIRGIRRDLTAGWRDAVRGIDAVLSDIEACLDRGRKRTVRLAGRGPGLARDLKRAGKQTVDDLGAVEGRLQDPARLLAALTRDADEALKRVEAAASRMPESLILRRIPPSGVPVRRPGGGGRAVRLRDAALQAFDARRSLRIRSAPSAVSEAVARAHLMVAELREVSAYGYEAAVAELSERGSAAADPVQMVTDGLDRAGEKVEAARGLLFDALTDAIAQANTEVARGLDHLLRRATADPVTAHYLAARTRAATEAAGFRERWQARVSRAGSGVSGVLRAVMGRLWPVRRALGIGTDVQSRAERRARTLAFADEVPGNLPVVYRRLFSFEPLDDPRLLAGRDGAVAAVLAAWHRRGTGDARSMMVIAPQSAGVTSFLNVVARKLGGEGGEGPPGGDRSGIVRHTLRERVREESGLAGWLAGRLGIEGAPDLDSLAGRVLDAPEGSLPQAVVLEGAEQLHMRVPGGGRLFERFLTLTALTESRVFWVLSMAASAWQLAEKRSPAWVADIERVVLNALSPDELKRAILARHRLSGLPLKYVESRTGHEMLLRRTRSLRGTDRHRRLIEADYFQKLHRASLGSIRLALFHWLRSADFRTVEGSLLVQPLDVPPPFVDAIDVEQSFALKAILDHGALTVAEYCEVARGSPPEGRHLFRTMADLRVIEAVPGSPPAPEAGYRIRPLMNGPVAAHLRSLRVLH